MRKIVALLALLLAACSTPQPTEPTIVTHDVNMPVTGSCVPDNLGPAPTYADTDAALKSAPDAAERYRLIASGRHDRDVRLSQLEPVIDQCRKNKNTVTLGGADATVINH